MAKLLDTDLVDLGNVSLKAGEDAFSPGAPADAVTDAVEQFRTVVYADGWDIEARRALGWLLNLPDDRLLEVTQRLRMAFPNNDVVQKRRFLDLLWKETFADWRVEGFDPDGFALKWER